MPDGSDRSNLATDKSRDAASEPTLELQPAPVLDKPSAPVILKPAPVDKPAAPSEQ